MIENIADSINTLGNYCGIRDIDALTPEQLKAKYNIERADVMALFGGSIMCGVDVLASAIKNKIAEKYVIVGGAGHTTETLRKKVQEKYPSIVTSGLSEAEVFQNYLKYKYGLEADYLETESTNCGNNITNLLQLLRFHHIGFKSIIISQDATMQRRMYAGLRKYLSDEIAIINYATYHAEVKVQNGQLVYTSDISGMWETKRYIELLLGEIPRLSDNADGYGPKGKNYIAHMDIPENVQQAFNTLRSNSGISIRAANPLYAST